MKDMILIQPPLSRKERYGVLSSSGSCLPPFGLAWLGAVLEEDGFTVSVIDSEALLLDCNEVVKQVLLESPSVVGLTGSTISIGRAGKVAAQLRSAGYQGFILLGGPHVTACPEDTIRRFPDFNILVIGEGEKTLRELFPLLIEASKEDSVKLNDRIKAVRGIAFIDEENKFIKTEVREYLSPEELGQLPLPSFKLLPPLDSAYQPSALRSHRLPSSSLITTRGCGGKCTFCDNSVFGTRVRGFPANYIIEMVRRFVEDYGIKDITFYDDNFLVNKKRLKEFCALLKNDFPQVSWSCNARVDVITEELVTLVKENGCWQMSVGIESGVQDILDVEYKGITLQQVEKAVNLLHKHGIKTKGFFMIGHPGETEESVQKTIDFALSLPLDDFQMSFLTPFPGTCIYHNASSYGELSVNWDEMNMWTPVFVPFGFTRQRLIELQSSALRKFYFRPRIVLRYLWTCIRTPSLAGAVFRGGLSLLKGVFSSKRSGVDS
jgi:radical SAM superfamily enzyme YgiQ (UPF0313 family)